MPDIHELARELAKRQVEMRECSCLGHNACMTCLARRLLAALDQHPSPAPIPDQHQCTAPRSGGSASDKPAGDAAPVAGGFPRYFRHVSGFRDGTKFIRCDSKTESMLVMNDGSELAATQYPFPVCLELVRDGCWTEIPAPPSPAPVAGGWISVKERLPERNSNVLYWHKPPESILDGAAGYPAIADEWHDEDHLLFATAWMLITDPRASLPAPPPLSPEVRA